MPLAIFECPICRRRWRLTYEDDSQICELSIRRAYDKDRPRIELGIEHAAHQAIDGEALRRAA